MESPYLTGSVCPSPVCLVLSEWESQRNAATVSFFSEVAHHPTALWISIARTSLSHELIDRSSRFSLILLHEGQRELAIRCGTASGRDTDKCAALDLYQSDEGDWFMNDAMVALSCRVSSRRDVDDHTLFIANILDGERSTRHSSRRHLLTVDLV